MFFELAELPPNSITDAAVRAAIAARYDSIPLQSTLSAIVMTTPQPGTCHWELRVGLDVTTLTPNGGHPGTRDGKATHTWADL